MNRPALTWHINRPLTLLALLLLPLLISLGFWQLSRAEEKRVAQHAFAQRRAADAVALSTLSQSPAEYTNVVVTGEFDNRHTVLIDNRIQHGRFGYEVVSPLRVAGGERWLLVNRGWIAGDPGRRTLPSIPAVPGDVELHGHLYRDHAGFELPGAAVPHGWPRIVSHLDFEQLGAALNIELQPVSLRLDADSPAALEVDWRVVNLGPEQHIGYAVQWFSMAFALVVAWLLASSNLWQLIKGAAAPTRGENRDD